MDRYLQFRSFDLEFLSADELITVTPTFRLDTIHFIVGDFGPFRPAVPIDVPLWLALILRRKSLCKISAPEWLTVAYLQQKLDAERAEDTFFEEVDRSYFELTMQILEVAGDDLKESERIRSLVQELWIVRQAKIRKGLLNLRGEFKAVRVRNLSTMEMNIIRDPFSLTMGQFKLFSEKAVEAASAKPLYATASTSSSTPTRTADGNTLTASSGSDMAGRTETQSSEESSIGLTPSQSSENHPAAPPRKLRRFR